MAKLAFPVKDDLIQPEYPCGKADKAISIHEHGSAWCIWKLQDISEKHLNACKTCKNTLLSKSDKELKEFFMAMTEEGRKAAEAYRLMQLEFATAIAALGEFFALTPVEQTEIVEGINDHMLTSDDKAVA